MFRNPDPGGGSSPLVGEQGSRRGREAAAEARAGTRGACTLTEHPSQNLRRIFDRLIDAPAGERTGILNQECGGDAELRRRLQVMVAAAEEDGKFLVDPTGETMSPVSAEAATRVDSLRERPGTRIGPYKLLQLIGEGGFGSVFMAEQERPVQRKVALKIIKLGMDTRQVVARFEQERQALAMMDHPNIARVLDAGATETGRPYFVMDLVKGEPIADYCDKHNLTIQERLELFGQVCSAVQHAHTKGIIHRDIKPSNILVSTQDGRPAAKVIDFGIAKATGSKLTEKTLFTEHRQLIGTPEYMSPEQAEGSLDIDTRTDVYSLGVLLYELLTGSTPFGGDSLRHAAYGEIQRIIREVDPPNPSARLSQSAETLASVAANRRSEPQRLGAIVRGELDWIVMKALEKDRQRRYESASGLATDIQRYLTGEAVTAAPPGRIYKLRKTIRRNRGKVTAAAAVAASLLVGVVGFAWQARQAASQRDVAVAARDAAELERRRAESIAQFIRTALQTSDPHQGGDQGMLVADAMLRAVAQIDQGEFKDQPKVEASLLLTISNILRGNGRSREALPLAQRALSLYRQIYPQDHEDVAAAMDNLAQVQHAEGMIDEPEPLLVQALEMRRRLFPGDNAGVATSLDNLASERDFLGRTVEAEAMYVEALEMRRRLFPGNHPDVALSLANAAFARHAQGDYTKAQELYTQALEMRRALFKGDHPATAMSLNSLAYVLQDQGKLAEADPIFVQALEMHRRLFKGDHPDIAMGLNNLGFLRKAQNRLEDAEQLLQQALEMCERLYPGDHPNVEMPLSSLADVRAARGHAAEAEPLYIRSLEMNRRLYHGDEVRTAKSLFSLAQVRRTLGRKPEARQNFDESIAMLRRIPPEQGLWALCRVLWLSAKTRMDDGDPAGALPEAQEAFEGASRLENIPETDLSNYRTTLQACKDALAAGK